MSDGNAVPSGAVSPEPPVTPHAPQEFVVPDLTARLESDIIIMDAVRSFLVHEPPDSALTLASEVITEDVVEKASPTFLLVLRRLLTFKGAMPDYAPGTNIREVMFNVLHKVTMNVDAPESQNEQHPPPLSTPQQQPAVPAAGIPARTLVDVEREQREYVAYQQARRGVRQLFVSPFTQRRSSPATAASPRIAAGPQPDRGFQARAERSPGRGPLSPSVPPEPLVPAAVGVPETRDARVETTQTTSRSSPFRVTPLPLVNPAGVHPRMGDLIKSYPKDMKYTGRDSDYQSLARFQQAYTSKCALFNLTESDALKALLIAIDEHSPAGEYFYRHLKDNPEVSSLTHAFDYLHAWYRSQSRVADLTDEWHSLRYAHFHTEGKSMRESMEMLYEKAVHLQSRLDSVHQPDALLIEVLRTAVREEDFSLFIDYNDASKTSREFYQRCMNAIRKQEWRNAKLAVADRQSGRQPDAQSDDTASMPSSMSIASSSSIAAPRNVLFARTGRRYGTNNARRSFRRPMKYTGKNPIRNGKPLLCRQCNADDHFIRDCPEANRPGLVYFAASTTDEDVFDMSMNETLDLVQELPDSEWKVLLAMVADTDDTENRKEQNPEPSEVLFTRSADYAELHRLAPKRTDLPEFLEYRHDAQCFFNQDYTETANRLLKEKIKQLPDVKFEGIALDNGASKTPGGLPAYLRYCKHTGTEPFLSPSSATFSGIENGSVPSLGLARLRMPLQHHGFIEFDIDIIDKEVPLLFGLDQHLKHSCSSNEVFRTFTHHILKITVPLNYKNGHLYLEWPSSNVLFTRLELKKLHNRFAHPSVTALINLLKRSGLDEMPSETRRMLEDIARKCKECEKYAPKPAIFKVSMPEDTIEFNHEIEVDLFFIHNKPILHIIDRGTRYSVARFISSQSAEYVWNVIVDAWVTVFTGFPNIIAHDQGTNFDSAFFQGMCSEFGIVTKRTPTQSHNSLSICERYHHIIRRVFLKVESQHPQLGENLTLAIAVHAVNTTAGPKGIVPALLLFGTLPKLPIPSLETVARTQKERFCAIESARKEMLAITAQRRIREALRSRSPYTKTLDLNTGDQVMVYREELSRYEGPFTLESYDGRKTAYVIVPDARGRDRIQPYSVTAVKPAAVTDAIAPEDITSRSVPTSNDVSILRDLEIAASSDNNENMPVFHVTVYDPHDPRFDAAKKDEVKQLLEKETYKIVSPDTVPPHATVLKSRFVLTLKTGEDGSMSPKARLVVLGHLDPEKERVVNEAPTIHRSSVRLLLTLHLACFETLWTRDVKQAFVQSEDALKRELYILPPKGQAVLETIGAPPGSLLKVIKPLYGIPESPSYWWSTMRNHHVKELGMKQTVLDPCLFYKRDGNEFVGMQGTLVDDTIATGSEAFAILEEKTSQRFECKPKSDILPVMFGGVLIADDAACSDTSSRTLTLSQFAYTAQIEKLQTESCTSESFANARGKLAYAVFACRPDLSFDVAQLSQVSADNVDKKDILKLNNVVDAIKNEIPLTYRRLDKESLAVVGYADAGFANNTDHTSQLGMFVLLKDKDNNAAIIHFSSWKCRRITRSVLAAEVHAFSSCYDYCVTLAHDLSNMLGRKVDTFMFTDSKSLFDTITKLSSVSEKRLLIDIAALREAYVCQDLKNVAHVSSQYNIADVLTKSKPPADCRDLLHSLMRTGKLAHPINQWIIHNTGS